MQLEVDWTRLKTFLDNRKLSAQFEDWGDTYLIIGIDGRLTFFTKMPKVDTPDPQNPDHADQIDFETNYMIQGNIQLEDRDEAGRTIIRNAATRKGWHYQAHSISFEVGKKDSLYNKDDVGQDLGFSTIKFYDAGGTDITDQDQLYIDTNAVKTVVKWAPTFDYDIISGSIRQISKKNSDMFMYVNAMVYTGLPSPYDWVKVSFVQGGINLNYIGADEPLKTDGRASKLFKGTNGDYFDVIINHNQLEKHKITVIFEIYKDPLS